MSGIRTLPSSAIALEPRAIERRVGLILLATDHTTEADFARLVASRRIGVFATRIEYANPVTPENLRAMQPRLAAASNLILPEEELDVVCFSCSSASVVIGDDAVETAIRSSKPGVPVVTPASAAARSLEALGARRIAILTPYSVETTAPVVAYYERRGFEIARVSCLGLEDDRIMARLAPSALVDAAQSAMPDDADALFISCTALRTLSAIGEIEARIGRPVVTSNQATAWACLGLIGALEPRGDTGRLFELAFHRAA